MMGGGAMHRNNNNKSPFGSWSMSSSSRIDTNRSTILVPDCHCGLRTSMFRANTLKNAGRLFYTCPFHKKDLRNCKYFIWLDDWEAILASEAAANGEEKNLSRNDGRKVGDGREVGKRSAIDENGRQDSTLNWNI